MTHLDPRREQYAGAITEHLWGSPEDVDEATSAVMEHADAERQAAEADAERYKQDYLNACKTIADMHAAATGRTGMGPVRGVVEDVEDVRLRAERAEAAITRVRALATATRDATAAGRNDWQIGQHDCALTVLAALGEPAPAATEAAEPARCCGKPAGALCAHDIPTTEA